MDVLFVDVVSGVVGMLDGDGGIQVLELQDKVVA